MTGANDSGRGRVGGLPPRVLGIAVLTVLLLAGMAIGASYVLGLGQGAEQRNVATFSWSFERVDDTPNGDDWGVLNVTHRCGARFPMAQLYLDGSGFNDSVGHRQIPERLAAAPETHYDYHRTWNGTASYERNGTGGYVGPGDTMLVHVNASYRIDLVWLGTHGPPDPFEAGSASAIRALSPYPQTIDSHTGPAADPIEDDESGESSGGC